MFDDPSAAARRVPVAGRSARPSAVADNIANIETPGCPARKVEIEDALRGAVEHGNLAASVRPQVATSLKPTRLNGSNLGK